MDTHPLWRPYAPSVPEQVDAAYVSGRPTEPVEVVAPDEAWPGAYARLRSRLAAALGDLLLDVEHIGSTAVPGLAAKPVIDVDVVVPDSADESAWLPRLEAAGFVLRVREPEWEQHRCLRGEDPPANVHVWSRGSREPRRHVAFRDRLRAHDDEREAYGRLKQQIAAQGLDVVAYNDAKAGFVYDLYERVFADDPRWLHAPHPR